MERSVSPAGLGAAWRGAPSLAPDFTFTGLHFQASSNPPSFSSRIWRGRLVVTAHRISTGTRGQKPWCLGCSGSDGRPRRPQRHQVCPRRHLIFSPPLPRSTTRGIVAFFVSRHWLTGLPAKFFSWWCHVLDGLRVASQRPLQASRPYLAMPFQLAIA